MQLFRAEPVRCTRASDPEGAHSVSSFFDKRKSLLPRSSIHGRDVVLLDVELEVRVLQMVPPSPR